MHMAERLCIMLKDIRGGTHCDGQRYPGTLISITLSVDLVHRNLSLACMLFIKVMSRKDQKNLSGLESGLQGYRVRGLEGYSVTGLQG